MTDLEKVATELTRLAEELKMTTDLRGTRQGIDDWLMEEAIERLERRKLTPTPTDKEPLLISAEQTAQILGITKARVYALSREGILPVVRLGRQTMFSRAALTTWIEGGGKALDGPGGWHKKPKEIV